MTDELLIKYISGQCSIEEKAEIQNWLKSDESHDRLFELEQLWGLKAEKQFADKARLDKSYEPQAQAGRTEAEEIQRLEIILKVHKIRSSRYHNRPTNFQSRTNNQRKQRCP